MGEAKRRQLNGSNGKVVVGFCHGDRIHPQWRRSLTQVILRDANTAKRIIGEIDMSSSGAHVATGRCKIVRGFLAIQGRPEWLWMVDTDATFAPEILDQLLAAAHPVERPIVGGLAFGVKPETDERGDTVLNAVGASRIEVYPTLYVLDEASGRTAQMRDYPRDSVVEVDGTGCHCLLIHRSVFEHEIWDTSHPLPWFRSSTVLNGGEVSEDLFFCLNARAAGFTIVVNTAAKTGHVKELVVDESLYLAQRGERPTPTVDGDDLEVSDVVLVVPSRGRPERAGELAESWRATTGGRSVLWVCVDDDDDLEAYRAALGEGVHLLVGPRQQMCPWTNQAGLAAAYGGARVVASLGDDHRLVGDWEAQVLGAVDDAGGTAIVYGDDGIQHEWLPTACFVTADIVKALGWVCLPGLEHLFCDNVWKTLGEVTGTLRYLPDMSTPHLHPVAGLAEWDDSYRETNAPAAYDRDRKVFEAWLADGVVQDASKVMALLKVPA